MRNCDGCHTPCPVLKEQDFYRPPSSETAQRITLLHGDYRFYMDGTIYTVLCILHQNTIVKCPF